jgi:8-oxo-dGTP pyrophosphatase MutT (NUDIX family)/phosphohistidine phosphatase SixA
MASSKPGSRLIKAAGGVAWRPGPDGEPEILLVHRKRYDDWSLPKGKTEPGELLPVTAVREVFEEGGARLALGRRLISVRYQVGGRPKRVHYWAARVAALDDRAVPNDEVDQIAWVGAAHAVEHVSYPHDHGVLADFARLPPQTVPVILLRHAKAVHKASWSRADARRPLDDSGRADAKALAELLACFVPRTGSAPNARLITSPTARCVETLRPFAELYGEQLREEPSLYVHHEASATAAADSHLSVAALVSEAVAAGEPVILCAHRENIPDLQTAVLAAVGIAAPGADAAPGSALVSDALARLPALPKDWAAALPTSAFWVLNLAHPPAPVASPASASAPAPASSSPPVPAAPPSPPSPIRRRWFAFGRSAPRPAGRPATSESTEPPRVVFPRLISADRYDLSEP